VRRRLPVTRCPLLPEAIRSACLRAAIDAYEDAGLRGLCEEGRWECAVDAIRNLDLRSLLEGTDTGAIAEHDPPLDE
jgi:hypothetical protein